MDSESFIERDVIMRNPDHKFSTVRLARGEYEIQVKPSEIRGGELMRLFNVSLAPVK